MKHSQNRKKFSLLSFRDKETRYESRPALLRSPSLMSKGHTRKFKIKTGELAFSFFLITRTIAIFLSFPCLSDVGLYLHFFIRGHVFGMTPYSGFSVEYPPLAFFISYIPGLALAQDISFERYYLIFALMMFFIDYCCLKTCQFYCKENLKMNERETAYMTLLYSLFGLLMFKIIYHRLDMAVGFFIIISLVLFQAKKKHLPFNFFANAFLGFFYKIIPAFNVPIAIIAKAFKNSGTKKIIVKIILDSAIFAAALVIGIWVIEIFANHHFIENMAFHGKRGIQLESSYASLLLLKNLLLGNNDSPVYYHYSWNILGNSIVEFIAKIFGSVVFLIFYAALFFTFLRKKIAFSNSNFLEATFVTLLLFLSFQRVLSTQFFIWIIPIASIWLAKNRSLKSLLVFLLLYLCTFFIFSINYMALTRELPLLVLILALRNFILVGFTCFITVNFFKNLNEQN